MQAPDGTLKPITEFFSDEELKVMDDTSHQLVNLQQKATELEAKTGKPHPVFVEGEVVEIKGGKFRVHRIMGRKRLVLKPIQY